MPSSSSPVLEGALHLEVVLRPLDVGPQVGERVGRHLVVLRAPLVVGGGGGLDDVAAHHARALRLEPDGGGDGGGGRDVLLREGVLPHQPRGRGRGLCKEGI